LFYSSSLIEDFSFSFRLSEIEEKTRRWRRRRRKKGEDDDDEEVWKSCLRWFALFSNERTKNKS